MKKNIKGEQASIAVYVCIVLIGFLFVLAGLYFTSNAVRQSQLQTVVKIKESYEKSSEDIESIYRKQSLKGSDFNAPKATITVNKSAVLAGSSVIATVEQSDEENNIDYTRCRYVCNTESSYIGTDEDKYTGGAVSSAKTSLTILMSSSGTYYIHTLTVDKKNNAIETISCPIEVISKSATTYSSANSESNKYYTYTAPADGTYKLEVWGAQGGGKQISNSSDTANGGLGGYSYGEITLKKGQKLYVYVGGMGKFSENGKAEGGYNGGGSAWASSSSEPANGGGGASDIRVGSTSLYARVIVAGGGRSEQEKTLAIRQDTAEEQVEAQVMECLLLQQQRLQEQVDHLAMEPTLLMMAVEEAEAGMVVVLSGGSTSPATSNDGSDTSGGAGGSGYVYTSSTASSYPSGCTLNSSHYLKNASTKAGNTSFTSPSGGTETGHSGNGYAKITPVDVTISGGESKTTASVNNSENEPEPELKPDAIAPTVKITVAKTTALTGESISAIVEQADNEDSLDLSKCRYVYNTKSGYIGTSSSDYSGGQINSATKTLSLSSSSAGTYYLHTLSVDMQNNAIETISAPIVVTSASASTYSSPSSYSTYTAPADGTYKLQVWGAQGGYRSSSSYGGKGGYSVGTITLTKGTKLYVYVGGAGGSSSSSTSGVVTGGYNGGGYRYGYKGGGGATDIRLVSGSWNNSSSLLSRIIVAGGGGSDGSSSKKGMYGGGTSGGSSTESYTAHGDYCGKGGTQTCSGVSGHDASSQATSSLTSDNTAYYGGFGFGGAGINKSSGYGGAGGGGWYGGSGTVPDGSGDDDRGGGGGSGFVWTSSTSSNVPSGYSVPTKYYLTSAATYAGDTSFESTSGGTETGHSGNGYAKITPVSIAGSSATTYSANYN